MFRPQMRVMRRLAVLAGVLCLPPFPGLGAAAADTQGVAAHDALPSVQSVLERYVTATGGREALQRHKSMTIRGHYQVPAKGLDVEAALYTEGGKSLQVVTMPAGESRSGYDGRTAWDVDSHGKITILHGDVVKSVARDADMYYHLHVMQYFRNMEVEDVQTFNGHTCYHLKGINNWGRQNEQFYDKETGLLIGYAFNTAWRGGNGAATQVFENYRDFGGVLMPTKDTTRDGSDLTIFTITSVTWDDVPDSMFALPARHEG